MEEMLQVAFVQVCTENKVTKSLAPKYTMIGIKFYRGSL